MRKTVLITGATSGIGLALAHLFAKAGDSLILVARYENTLKPLQMLLSKQYKTSVDYFAVDLTKPGGVEELTSSVISKKASVDILINNAGFGNYGEFEKTDLNTDIDLIALNILTVTTLTKQLLPSIIRKKGKILNVGSVASFLPGPFMNTYFASKAYVLSFSIALREELSDRGVTVTCLCPGPTNTNFGKRAHYDHALNRQHVMNVETVAAEAYRGLLAGKALVIPGWKNKVIVAASPFIPKTLMAKIVRRVSGY